MKFLTVALIAAVSTIAIAQPASAQRPTRDRAIAQCVAMAQKAIPDVVEPSDPRTNERVNIYKSCMKKLGYRG